MSSNKYEASHTRLPIGEWLRLLAAECYSGLGEGEHQHVLCIVLNHALSPAVKYLYACVLGT